MASSGGGSGGQPPLVKGMIFASTKTLRKEATLALTVVRCRAPAALWAVLDSTVFLEESEGGLLPQESLWRQRDNFFDEGRLPAAAAAGRSHACFCAACSTAAAAAVAAVRARGLLCG